MKRICLLSLLCCPLLAQNEPRTPLPPRDAANAYLRAIAADHGLSDDDLQGVYVAKEYRTAHNGVTHLVLRQRFQGLEVANTEWVINIDRDGVVVNAGGTLAHRPAEGLAPPDPPSALAAVRAAAGEVNPELAERYLPFGSGQTASGKNLKFSRGGFGDEIAAEAVWFAVKGVTRPAWKFHIVDADGIQSYSVVVDTARRVLSKESHTFRQAPPRGLVFERSSPQPNPRPGILLKEAPPLVNRTPQSFAGDPKASPKGWLDGAETAGNNVVAGANTTGLECFSAFNCFARPATSVAANRDFSFPLQLGEGASFPTAFIDAATVNLFYWINRAHDLFYELGFDEAAGNFQQDNFYRGGVGGDPVYAYSQFGIAGLRGPAVGETGFAVFRDDDGSQARIAITFDSAQDGRLFDDDFDAETIIHEYAHGVSRRLVRQLAGCFQCAAMGEGWSDFFALEFLTPEGAPPDGAYPFSEYPNQFFGAGIRTRPYSTNLEINPLTYAHLGHVDREPEVHADGEIWMEALWEMRANLIRQFGEREGRRRARLLVIDGMKLSPPAPSMVDMRDAILLADRVDFKSASQDPIWAAFARRGLGATAMSLHADAVHVAPSFQPPSPVGSLRFYEDTYVIGEQLRVVLQDSNLDAPSVRVQLTGSSGDLENLLLRRKGSVYVGFLRSGYAPVGRGDGILELIPGDIVSGYYVDADAGGSARLIQTSVPTTVEYFVSPRTLPFQFAGERSLGMRRTTTRLVALPFEFPYFGKNYSVVRVYNNGLLTFDLPNFMACTDAASLAALNAAAPMWMNLRTDGAAQPGEDVYISTGPDWVTFRWAAETDPDFAGSRPEPVNFAATLYRDGRIQFQYGSGNRNLTSGSQVFGCPVAAPTVGISNGHETFVQVAVSHDSKGTLENAATLVFDPPYNHSTIPVGRLESPAAGDRVQDVLSGRGIVYDTDPEGSIRRLDLLIDGIAEDRLDVRTARPDFCDEQNVRGCPNVGFTFHEPLELLAVKPGAHTLQLRATNRRGAFVDFPETPLVFEVGAAGAANPPFGKVESPAEGAQISGRLPIRGYVAAEGVRIIAVELLIDGINFGLISYGDVRNDVCAALPARPPNCPRIGFSGNLNTAGTLVPLPNGKHTVAVRAIDESGRLTIIPEKPISFVLDNPVPQPPKAVLDSPRPNQRVSGMMTVSGYAWSPGSRIARVVLVIDNVAWAEIPYGQPRPEACAQLPDAQACPGIGFALEFDTRRLSNGPHTMYVFVQDERSGSATVPAVGFYGMNFLVDN